MSVMELVAPKNVVWRLNLTLFGSAHSWIEVRAFK